MRGEKEAPPPRARIFIIGDDAGIVGLDSIGAHSPTQPSPSPSPSPLFTLLSSTDTDTYALTSSQEKSQCHNVHPAMRKGT